VTNKGTFLASGLAELASAKAFFMSAGESFDKSGTALPWKALVESKAAWLAVPDIPIYIKGRDEYI
jgi:hypothetical protein